MLPDKALWTHVSSSPPHDLSGGVQSVVARMVHAMSAHADQQVVVARVPPKATSPLPQPYLGIRGSGRISRSVNMAKTLWAAAGRSKIFFCHYLPHYMIAPRLWRRRNVVFVFHGPASLEARVEGKSALYCSILHVVEKIFYLLPRNFVCLSQFSRSLLIDHYGVDASRIHVIPGVAEVSASTDRPERTHPEIRLLCVRRLVKRMGIQRAIQATTLLAGRGISVELRIVGTGPEEAALQALANAASGKVQLLGRLSEDELNAQYEWADAFMLPTIALEGFGMVILEAVRRGVPVVGTPVGAIPEVIGTLGLPNIVAASTAPEHLADAVMECIRSRRHVSMRRCQENLAANYGPGVVARRYVDLARSLAQ